MLMMIVLAFCVSGVVFMLWFLVALFREKKSGHSASIVYQLSESAIRQSRPPLESTYDPLEPAVRLRVVGIVYTQAPLREQSRPIFRRLTSIHEPYPGVEIDFHKVQKLFISQTQNS